MHVCFSVLFRSSYHYDTQAKINIEYMIGFDFCCTVQTSEELLLVLCQIVNAESCRQCSECITSLSFSIPFMVTRWGLIYTLYSELSIATPINITDNV